MDEKQGFEDLIVVGAGIGGLCAAKTYLQLAPGSKVTVLEAHSTVGGVWCEENLYEGLKTNNLYGTYEYEDFPMDPKVYDVQEGWHIPGQVMFEYLTDYARNFNVYERIRFETRVDEIEKLDDGWKLTTAEAGKGKNAKIYYTRKLIMCNGLASNPNSVNLQGREKFDRPIFHHGELRSKGEAIAKDPNVKSVTVVGASKIGYDAVFLFASHGKQVDWIVRKSGGGAVWMSSPWVKLAPGWTEMLEHVACMRLFTWFSPCIWGFYDGFGWIRSFLARTRIGRWLTDSLWEQIRTDVVDGNGYRKEEKLKHLEPFESLFWSARVGILNYASDPHEFLRSGQVTLHHEDVTLSRNGTVQLANGTQLTTDAIVQITGWQLAPTIKWKPEGLDASLGIPSTSYSQSELDFWADLDAKADKEILCQFPRLRNPPERKLPFTQKITPFRLYRGVAPPGLTAKGDRSLCFLKMVHCTSNLILAETQSLWAFAYLNNKPLNIDEKDVHWQTALSSRFGKWRYPWGFSQWYPEFVYDAVPYADILLTDLGLRKWRKGSWKKEMFEGYTVKDYRGIKQEWVQKEKWSWADAKAVDT